MLNQKVFMNMKSQLTTQHKPKQLSKRITSSTISTLCMTVAAAAALFIAAPYAKAATAISTADQKFILAASQGAMTGVKLGELAAQNGQRDDVKSFGKMMVKEHTSINDDLKALAVQKGVVLPESLDKKNQATVDKMAALTGSKFDDAYIASMIKDHKNDIKEYKAESDKTKDEDIQSFLKKSTPSMEEHLKLITAMDSVRDSNTKNSAGTNQGDNTVTNTTYKADNTGINKRDRDKDTLTPLDQGNTTSDINTTAEIRKGIIAKDGMSVNAKNVKIITANGEVTLRGPVDTADEKRQIGEIADNLAGANKVSNQLEVKKTASNN